MRVAYAGAAGSLSKAAALDASRDPSGARLGSLMRRARSQLTSLDAGQVAGLSGADQLVLGAQVGAAMAGLRDNVAALPRGQKAATAELAKLEDTVANKLGALRGLRVGSETASLSGPGIIGPLDASRLAQLRNAAADPKQRAVLAELLESNPHHPGIVLDTILGSQGADAAVAKMAAMYPGADSFGGIAKLRGKLTADLAKGGIESKLVDGMKASGLGDADVGPFLDCFAECRQAFEIGAAGGDDMQRTNWIHTRIEVLHTLDAAQSMGLSRDETLAALYGSLFSDAFKDAGPYSVAFHNRLGAEVVTPLVMGRHLDLAKPENQQLLERSMRVAHEHQITPPLFMAGASKGVLMKHIAERYGDQPGVKADKEARVGEIFDRLMNPLDGPQRDGEMLFSDGAQSLLREVGIPGWAVPYESDHRRASMAAIAGDVWQYVSPDGIMKYTHDLRDPEHPVPMFRDPIISMRYLESAQPERAEALKNGAIPVRMGAAESSLDFSFGQGMSVMAEDQADLVAFMNGKKAEMDVTLSKRVFPEVERRLRAALKVPDGAPTPDIVYWNAPVGAELDPKVKLDQRAQIDLVKSTFERVVAEDGGVPMDPFGHRRGAHREGGES